MIVRSYYTISFDGQVAASDVQALSEGQDKIDADYPGYILVNEKRRFEGESAVDAALGYLERQRHALAKIRVENVVLTLSFYYEEQCTPGFDKQQLKQLGDFVDILSIDCYPEPKSAG